MAEQPKLKAYVSAFTIHLGPISMVGRLISTKKPGQKSKKDPTSFVMVTPKNERVVQRYIVDGKPKVLYEPSDLSRARVLEDGTLVPVEQEVIAEAKTSVLPKDILNVTVHDAEEVDAALIAEGATMYVFEPDFKDPVNVQWHSLMLSIMQDHPEFAYVGVCNLRNNEGLFRLGLWRDRLVVQKMVYPDQIEDHQPLADAHLTTVDKPAMTKAVKMMTKLTAPFGGDKYVDNTRERLAALATALETGGETPVILAQPKQKTEGFDLAAALDAFGD